MRLLSIVILSLTASIANAQDYSVGDISVMHPIARESAKMAQSGAGYFDVTNTGSDADTLLAVEADYPRVMMHSTVMDGDVAKMEHMMQVPLAPGETVSFAPGGHHVMFMGLGDNPFIAGDEIPATLVFEKAGRLDIIFMVESMSQNPQSDDESGK